MSPAPTVSPSVAILLYLTRKYETPDHWYPQDLQARARVDEYLAWQHTALRTSCTRTMWQKVSFGAGSPSLVTRGWCFLSKAFHSDLRPENTKF